MRFQKFPFSILNKEIKEMDYIKGIYMRRVQAEIESYKDFEEEYERDTIRAQHVLMFNKFSI